MDDGQSQNPTADSQGPQTSQISETQRLEIINNYLQGEVSNSKSKLCRFYRRGCCLFPANQCKFAHEAQDLQFERLEYNEKKSQPAPDQPTDAKGSKAKKKDDTDGQKDRYVEKKNNDQPSLGLEITYKGLYEYQFKLKERGEIEKIYTQQEIENDPIPRRSLRHTLQCEIQRDIVDLLFKEYNTNHLKKSFVEQCFLSIGWMTHWKYISNFIYEAKSPISGQVVVRQLQGEAFDEFMEDCVVKIIKDQGFIEYLPISPSLIMKYYYQYLGSLDPLMPSHSIYLKYRNIKSLDDYLNDIQHKERFINKLASSCKKSPEELAGVTIFDQLNKEMQEVADGIRDILLKTVEESEIGFTPYSIFLGRVLEKYRQRFKQLNQTILQTRKLMVSLALQENILIIHLNYDLYLLSLEKLKKSTLSKIEKKAYERLYNSCSLPATDHLTSHEVPEIKSEGLAINVPERQTEQFLHEEIDINKVYVVDTMESLQAAVVDLKDIKEVGVDLEGGLSKNGRLELVQCGTNDKIFLFDVYKVKKIAKEDPTKVALYNEMAAFLKTMVEDPKICKIFHDGRKDSLALHVFLDACPANVFDLSAVYVLIEHLEKYVSQKDTKAKDITKEKNGEEEKNDGTKRIDTLTQEAFSVVGDVKLPGLNEVLERYQASHGLNRLKYVMKSRFSGLPKEYFLQRPIDREFLIYSAKDVEDLIEVKGKMEKKLHAVLSFFVAKLEEKKVELICKEASKAYVLQGCQEFKE